MSNVDKTFLGDLGLTDKIRKMVKDNGGSASRVSALLVKDPEYKEAARGAGGRVKLFSKDVHDFITADALDSQRTKFEQEKEKALAVVQGSDPMVKPTNSEVVKIREATEKAILLADNWFPLAQRALRLLDDLMGDYEEDAEKYRAKVESGVLTDDDYAPQFPSEPIDIARKAVLSSIEVASKLKGDPIIQSILRTDAIVVNQGMTQEQFHQALFATAEALGISKTKILEGYAIAMAKKGGRDIIDATPLPPEPQWHKDSAAKAAAKQEEAAPVEAT